MEPSIARASDDDRDQLWRVSQEGFGATQAAMPNDYPAPDSDTRSTFVVKDGGRVVAKAVDRHFDSWWWHRSMPTAGVAGVSVQPERRGAGLLSPLMRELLHHAYDRGAVVSALFPSATAIYRRFGYQTVASHDSVTVPTQLLADVPAVPGRLERSDSGAPEVLSVYRSWASRQNGPLDREGAAYPMPSDPPGGGTTVAYDVDDRPVGVARWSREAGAFSERVQHVHDLYAITPAGFWLLARALGSSAMVVQTTEVMRSGQLGLATLLRGTRWEVTKPGPYMLAILDMATALTQRAWADGIDVLLRFSVTGLPIDAQNGAYRLEIANGQAQCERTGEVDEQLPCFTAGGFAQRYAGAMSNANLRFTGGLSGPSGDDIIWDALFGGWQCHILDSY